MQNRIQQDSAFRGFPHDILRLVFCYTDSETTMAAYQSCGMFKDAIVLRCYRGLTQEYGIPEQVVAQLQSPVPLFLRLTNLIQNKVSQADYARFIADCQNGDVDVLLQPWYFYPYNAEFQQQFLADLDSCENGVKVHYLEKAIKVGNLQLVKLLVEKYQVDLSSNNRYVMYALECHHTQLARYLLNNKADDVLALRSALHSGEVAFARYLIANHGAVVDREALLGAQGGGNIEAIKFCLEEHNVEPQSNTVSAVAKTGNITLVKDLISQDARVIMYCLHAAVSSGSFELLELFLARGLRPSIEHVNEAASRGNLAMVQLLHSDEIQLTGETLLNSVRSKNISLVQYCMSSGVQLTQTAMNTAASQADIAMFDFIRTHQFTPDQETLLCAMSSKSIAFVRMLIETYHLEPDALCFSRAVCCQELLEYLSEKYQTLDASSIKMDCVLVARCSTLRCLQIMVKHGAKPNGETMRGAMSREGDVVLMAYLIKEFDIDPNAVIDVQKSEYNAYLYERFRPSKVTAFVDTVRGLFNRLPW